MTSIVTDAVVLHAFDYLETSRVLRLSTRDAGLVAVIARGARRSARRFGAALDLFAAGTAEIHMKSGRDLQQLTAFDVTTPRPGLADDLDRFGSASMLAELAARCTAGEDQGDVFEALSLGFDGLLEPRAGSARIEGVRAAWQLTAALGFAPSTDTCAVCHAPVPAGDDARFASQAGGVLCAGCGRGVGGRTLPAAARDTLRRWLAGDEATVEDGPSQRAHARLLREFVTHHVAEGQALRAFDAWLRRFPRNPRERESAA
jgi:DNA repair protein RecO (recombination protein O)